MRDDGVKVLKSFTRDGLDSRPSSLPPSPKPRRRANVVNPGTLDPLQWHDCLKVVATPTLGLDQPASCPTGFRSGLPHLPEKIDTHKKISEKIIWKD